MSGLVEGEWAIMFWPKIKQRNWLGSKRPPKDMIWRMFVPQTGHHTQNRVTEQIHCSHLAVSLVTISEAGIPVGCSCSISFGMWRPSTNSCQPLWGWAFKAICSLDVLCHKWGSSLGLAGSCAHPWLVLGKVNDKTDKDLMLRSLRWPMPLV